MITTTGNIRTEEPIKVKAKAKLVENWSQTYNMRHYVNNDIPSATTSTLQQEWVSSEGITKWVDIPVVFSTPMPMKDSKS